MVFAILLTAVLSLGLYTSGIFVIFTPLPFILTYLRRGLWTAMAALVLALSAFVLLYKFPAKPFEFLPFMVLSAHWSLNVITALSLIYLSYYLAIALAVLVGGRFSASVEKTMALMSLGSLAIPALILTAFCLVYRFDLVNEVYKALEFLLQSMVALQESAGVKGEEIFYIKQYGPVFIASFVRILPGFVIDLTLVALSFNILLARRWAGRVGDKNIFPAWEDFSLWRLPEWAIWGPISVGILYFANVYLLKSQLLATALINILLVLGMVYLLQGMSVVSFFFKRKFSPWTRLMGYVAILLFIQLVGVLVMSLGIFDFWFDFRKVKKVA